MTEYGLSDVFDRLCERLASRVAIREANAALSFRELRDYSEALSRLLEPGIRHPGTPVSLLLPNSSTFVAAFFAIARVGGVVAPLNPQYRSQELGFYLADLEPAAVITAPGLVAHVVEVLPRLARPPMILEVGPERSARIVRSGSEPHAPVSYGVRAPLLLQYTSGSTGMAKKVVRSHAMLCAELEVLASTFQTSPADRFLGVTPFSHVNGLVRTMLSAMYAGATLYPVDGFRRREILDLVSRERLTFWGGVPQMFAILSQTPPRTPVDLSSLRIVFSSSAPLMPADCRRFEERYGQVIRQLYGSTETGTISFNIHPDPGSNPASVGLPLPGVEVDVVDAQAECVADGTEGELVIKSPFAASGYLENPEASRQSFSAGRYFSGDLGRKEEGGFLYITGRKKLLLNRAGFKVNPYEVEEAIAQHPAVREVVVFGAPGPHGDDLVCCVIVPEGDCTPDEIIRHCRDRIADHKIPTRIEFRESLPKSATGKVQRAKL